VVTTTTSSLVAVPPGSVSSSHSQARESGPLLHVSQGYFAKPLTIDPIPDRFPKRSEICITTTRAKVASTTPGRSQARNGTP
jgi:hypothetical protein